MSEEQPQQSPRMPKRIRFIVDCDMEKGEVQVQGPIQQKLLAIKILADAIHIVTDYKPNILSTPGNGKLPPLSVQ